MGEFGRGQPRSDLVPYGGGQSMEIVTGNVFIADRPHALRAMTGPPRRPPDEPPYYAKYELELDLDRRGFERSGGGWGCFSDPEMKRKRRVASYKAYSVEGRLKGKIRRGWRWVKSRCHVLVHGYV